MLAMRAVSDSDPREAPLSPDQRSRQKRLLLLLAGVGLAFLFGLFNHPPIPSMEPRFAEAVREMAARGQYLIPIKNGVPYIEYPPLYFWLSLAGKLIGLPVAAAIRLPGAAAFLLWLFWLFRLQKLVRPQWPAVLLPLTCAALPSVLYNFFTAQSDSVLILGVLIAFMGFVRFRKREGPFGFPWELWLGIALAVAAKGPVGLVLTLPIMGLEILSAAFFDLPEHNSAGTGRLAWAWREAWRLRPAHGLGLVLLLNGPWYIAAGLTVGWEFCRAVLVYQNFTRFFIGFDHLQPWWYYLKTLWPDLFPLSVLFPFGLLIAWKRRRYFLFRLCGLWALFTIVFFSFSQSKQGKYIFPAAPAVAILGLLAVEAFHSEVFRRRTFRFLQTWAAFLLTLFALLVIAVLPFYSSRIGGVEGFRTVRSAVEARPGRLVTYLWPRSMMLYELGAPLPYVRSARELYEKIHGGEIKPGDYVLVNRKYLPGRGAPKPLVLSPAPRPPFMDLVLTAKAEGRLDLYRILPGAEKVSIPATPSPPKHYWWEKFDTD